MALSQDGALIAISTVDIVINLAQHKRRDLRAIKVRQTNTGEEVKTFEYSKKSDITALAFHPNKRFLASGCNQGFLNIWDIQKGDLVTALEMEGSIMSVAFSPDGRFFAACSATQVGVWRLK